MMRVVFALLLTVTLLPFVLLSACRDAPSVAPETAANALEGVTQVAPAAANSLEVTYLANEGFMISGGGKKILIDALFGEGLDGYAVVSPTQRELLEQAREPFANVDAIFATHFHAGHFDADALMKPQPLMKKRWRSAQTNRVSSPVSGRSNSGSGSMNRRFPC